MKEEAEYAQDMETPQASPHERRSTPKVRSKAGAMDEREAALDPVVNEIMIRHIMAALTGME